MQEIVGGVVRYRDLCLRKFPAIRYWWVM